VRIVHRKSVLPSTQFDNGKGLASRQAFGVMIKIDNGQRMPREGARQSVFRPAGGAARRPVSPGSQRANT